MYKYNKTKSFTFRHIHNKHAPTELLEASEKEEFYKNLRRAYDKIKGCVIKINSKEL